MAVRNSTGTTHDRALPHRCPTMPRPNCHTMPRCHHAKTPPPQNAEVPLPHQGPTMSRSHHVKFRVPHYAKVPPCCGPTMLWSHHHIVPRSHHAKIPLPCRGPITTPCHAAHSAEQCLYSWTTLLCHRAHRCAWHDSLSRNQTLSSFSNTQSFSCSPFFRLVHPHCPCQQPTQHVQPFGHFRI